MAQQRTFLIIGLGKMGGNLARQALAKGIQVFGFDPGDVGKDLLKQGLKRLGSLDDVSASLPPRRVVLMYVPAGHAVDSTLTDLQRVLQPGDVVIDGGNSYWRDSRARHARVKASGIHFVDVGTSGGPEGALYGACFMVGGEREPVSHIFPILETLSLPGGLVHAGPPGAGHFAKLVHNGIEFGMMQAIGEGLDLLESFPEDLGISEVLEAWRHGTVIRSWLIDLLARSYRETNGLEKIPGYVEDTGEVNWLVQDAAQMEVPIPVIAQSVWQLISSRDSRRNWAKAIAAMRHGFGGHPFGPSEKIAKVRRASRIRDEAST